MYFLNVNNSVINKVSPPRRSGGDIGFNMSKIPATHLIASAKVETFWHEKKENKGYLPTVSQSETVGRIMLKI